MKEFLSRTWMVYGIGQILMMALCAYVGWYAVANAAVVITAAYCVHLARKRKKQLEDNKDVIRKMTRKQKKTLEAIDDKQVREISATSRMMPYLCFGCLLLNGYTYYYNTANSRAAAVWLGIPDAWNVWFLVIGMVFGFVFYFAFCFKMNEMMTLKD